jgi:SRSO17 transposase
MDAAGLRSLKPELNLFLKRYLPMFGRVENHEHAGQFVQGLLAGGDRRNIENIAEKVDGGVVRTLQKFISQAVWDDRDILTELRRHAVESLGDDDAVLNVDETGFPKKGTKSVGVKRQYAGILGRVDNCQIGVFVNYSSTKGHTLLDRRLFLPAEWAADRARRQEAGVPETVVFRTKPELGLEMVQAAATAGVRFRWVGGDSVYGDSPTFVQGVRALHKWYVVDTSADARVWTSEPTLRPVGRVGPKAGRPSKNPKAVEKPITVVQAAAAVPDSAWKRVTVAEGSQGPRVYEYTELVVWFSEEGYPAVEAERLLIRRSIGQEPEVKYQRSNAARSVPLDRLAAVGGSRWTIEQDFQAAKGGCGLDEYETRGWMGWHHHTILSMLALFFLELQRQRLGEKTSPDDRARSPRRATPPARRAQLGRGRDTRLVNLAAGTKPNRKRVSHSSQTPRDLATK